LIRGREIEKFFARLRIVNRGADRHRNLDRMALAAGPVTAFAMAPALGLMLRVIAEMEQSVVMRIRNQNDIAAAPAITAAGTAARNEFLSPESQTAISSIACLHGNNDFVYKHEIELIGMVWTAKRGGMSRPLIGVVGVPLALSDDVDVFA
jgi:hypothetical protein